MLVLVLVVMIGVERSWCYWIIGSAVKGDIHVWMHRKGRRTMNREIDWRGRCWWWWRRWGEEIIEARRFHLRMGIELLSTVACLWISWGINRRRWLIIQRGEERTERRWHGCTCPVGVHRAKATAGCSWWARRWRRNGKETIEKILLFTVVNWYHCRCRLTFEIVSTR